MALKRALLSSCLLLASCGAPAAVDRITLTVDTFGMPGPGVRLTDLATVPPGTGDLWIEQRSTFALFARAPDVTLCPLGTFASVDLAGTTEADCTSGLAQADNIGPNTDGTDRFVGRTWLVVAPSGAYRVRDVGDSVAAGTDTLILEVSSVP